MNNGGITAQYGFEFQRLVFLYNALQISPGFNICYENLDDVDVSQNLIPLCGIRLPEFKQMIQVKSGTIDNAVLRKIFLNWLLLFDDLSTYLCFMDHNLAVAYDEEFINGLIKHISNDENARKRKDSILRRVYDKYIKVNELDELKKHLNSIVNRCEFKSMSEDQIKVEIIDLMLKHYSEDNVLDTVLQERFECLLQSVRNNIAESMLKKSKYTLTHRELFVLLSDIKSRINESVYDVSFTDFKRHQNKKVEEIKANNGRVVKQLNLVSPKNSFILDRLTEKVFYEKLKGYFIKTNKKMKIDDVETTAKSNYDDVILDVENGCVEDGPFAIYRSTVSKELTTDIIKSNIKGFSNGCYISLTDEEVDESLRIQWGEIDE